MIILRSIGIGLLLSTAGPSWGAAAKANPKFYWADGIVPYAIDPSITDSKPILAAMKAWEKAGIRFPKRTNESDYVVFTLTDAAKSAAKSAPQKQDGDETEDPDIQNIGGARSAVGRRGGMQLLVASGNDVPAWRYMHEIGHTLGLFHEHIRLDRDRWVTIHFDNIAPAARGNFEIKKGKTFDVADFDVESIMLYKWNMNAVDKTKPTISWNADPSRRDFGAPIVQKLSAGDIAAVRWIYFEGGLKKLRKKWRKR
jgi:hypothetical protein